MGFITSKLLEKRDSKENRVHIVKDRTKGIVRKNKIYKT